MNNRFATSLAVTVATLTAGYWYFSPYLAMKATHDAAQARDAEAFNDRVDYPKLRESIKGQMTVLVTRNIGNSSSGAQGLGAMLGLALVNQMVDAVMRPEVMMNLMQAGEVKSVPGQPSDSDVEQTQRKKIDWTFERPSVDKVIAYAHEEGFPENGDLPSVVFERNGFADWKLTEIRIRFDR